MRRAARALCAFAVLAALLTPEWTRYRAERELRRQTAIVRAAVSGQVAPAAARPLLLRASALLAATSRAMPGDARPRMVAGSAALAGSNAAGAIPLYVDALRCGERGEVDLNLGRAFAAAGDARAEAMFVRAVWISPKLLDSVPLPHRARVRDEVARRSAPEGVTEPPPLPVLPAADAVLD
jgi:hypothetical protein